MSLRTKINGFTAWVNLRLTPYNQLLNNVLMDLLSGTHMKYLLESFTGSQIKGLENMDGLTDQQRQLRVDWMVDELKKKHVIAEDVFVDTRLFAMRSADQVFDLLWRLISHDIWFVWERAEYLQVDDLDVLTQVPFKWTPEPPPKKKKSKSKAKKSLLSGFGVVVAEEKAEDVQSEGVMSEGVMSGHWSTSTQVSNDMTNSADGDDNDIEQIVLDTPRPFIIPYPNDSASCDETESDSDYNYSYESKRQNQLYWNFDQNRKPVGEIIELPRKEISSPRNGNSNRFPQETIFRDTNPREKNVLAKHENTLELTAEVGDDYVDDEQDDREGQGSVLDEENAYPLYSNNVEEDTQSDSDVSESRDEHETERKEIVSIYMVPLKEPDDSAERLTPTTLLGKLSPWLSDGSPEPSDLVFESETHDNDESSIDIMKNTFTVKDSLSAEPYEDKFKFETNTEKEEDSNTDNLKELIAGTSYVVPSDETVQIKQLRESLEQSLKLTKRRHAFSAKYVKGWGDLERYGKEDIGSAKSSGTSTPRGMNPFQKGGNRSSRGSKQSSRRGSTSSKASKGSSDIEKQVRPVRRVTFKEGLIASRPNSTTPTAALTENLNKDSDDDEKWIKFPNAEYMKGFKRKSRKSEDYPAPDECILEMVNYQLKKHFSSTRHPSSVTRDGKGLFCYSIDDFVDSRVLCALVNSFVPNTFTADLLLNDRWTINLALKTAEKMFYAETPFDAEDLVEADPMAVSAYFAFFLMVAYRYRQTTAVVNRVDFINMLIRECNHDLEKFPPIISNMQELQRRKDIKQQLDKHRIALENLQKKYDVEFCRKWVQHVEHVQNELRREIRDKMRSRFEIVEIPRTITINDFCLAAVINLSLTNGSGFYLTSSKETLSDGRRLVLRKVETGDFVEDFTNKSKLSVRDALGLPDIPGQVLEINPEDHPEYEFYFEAPSRNKQLRTGSFFLYQVFPGNTITWQRLFIKSAREAEYETVEKMISFFREDSSFINCREPKSGNTALHWACRMGHFDVARLLLENGAKIDIYNNFKCSPINLAIEALQRRISHYLIEWGCDVHGKNIKGQTVLETIKNDDFKRYLMELYDYYSKVVPKIMAGDMELLDQVIADHASGAREFCCLRSRIINGSTLLHTACYYGHQPAIKELLSLRVDVNLRDYKGATPLHRAKNPDVMEILLEAGAHVNAEDSESNTPLHVKCYGETGKPSEIECIQMLLNKNVNLVIRNSRGLMPIHCCVMQGRIDVMQLLLKHDTNNSIAVALSKENEKSPPSLLHLALANDFPTCAEWLLQNGFNFKEKEQDVLMRRILTEQIKLEKRAEAIKFLLDNGADPSPKYPGGNSALHYAAGLSGPSDVLELLVAYHAEIDPINEEGCTPLFFAMLSNNKFAACVLIEHGANVRQKNSQGLTAFDYIVDFEEWIECGYFNEEIKARLKAYNLKHARDLIRAISKRVKPGVMPLMRPDMTKSAYALTSQAVNTRYRATSAMSRQAILPPVNTARASTRFLMS